MRKRFGRDSRSYFEEEADPMAGVSNLADAMLVLAVGIMLALIMNWHVSINGGYTTELDSGAMKEVDASEFTSAEEGEDSESGMNNLEERGTVYVDKETRKMYLVEPNED